MKKRLISITEEKLGEHYDEDYKYLIGDYVLKEWSFGDREDIIELASIQKVNTSTKKMEIQMRSSKYRVLTLNACIKKAPFTVNVKAIRNLPVFIAEYLYDEIADLNEGMSEVETKKFRDS